MNGIKVGDTIVISGSFDGGRWDGEGLVDKVESNCAYATMSTGNMKGRRGGFVDPPWGKYITKKGKEMKPSSKTINPESEWEVMDWDEMEIGRLGKYDGDIVLRAYDCLVSLTDPNEVYSYDKDGDFTVRVCPPGYTLKLTQEGASDLA